MNPPQSADSRIPPWELAWEALLLLSAWEIGFDLIGRFLARPLGGTPLGWLIVDASVLAGASLLVFAFNGFALRRQGLPPRNTGLQDLRSAAMNAAPALLALGLAAVLFRLLIPGFDDVAFARQRIRESLDVWRLAGSIPLLVAAEEIVFRACQERLRRAAGAWPAAVAVGSAFSLYHVSPGKPIDGHDVEMVIAAGVGGVILAALYERTGSVVLLSVVHILYDEMALAQGWLNVERRPVSEAVLFGLWIASAAVATLALLGWKFGGRPVPVPSRARQLSGTGLADERIGEVSMSPPARGLTAILFGLLVPLGLLWLRARF
jgi:membrane protease YdiL (CAAX protease family)